MCINQTLFTRCAKIIRGFDLFLESGNRNAVRILLEWLFGIIRFQVRCNSRGSIFNPLFFTSNSSKS